MTLIKHKNGLLDKARELSILCDCEIAVRIFNNTNGRCFEFSSGDTSRTLTRLATFLGTIELRGLAEVRNRHALLCGECVPLRVGSGRCRSNVGGGRRYARLERRLTCLVVPPTVSPACPSTFVPSPYLRLFSLADLLSSPCLSGSC